MDKKMDEKIKIKAIKTCHYCRGLGYAMNVFGGNYQICSCVTNQIKIMPTADEKTRLELFDEIEKQRKQMKEELKEHLKKNGQELGYE